MFKKIILGFVVLVVIAFGLAMWATSGITDVADNFFNKLKEKDYRAAYSQFMSEDFKTQVSFDRFKAYVKRNHFDRVKKTKWGNREVNGNQGKLEGSLITVNSGAIPIVLKFVKADKDWKIYAINKPQAGILNSNKKPALSVPSKSEQIALVRATMKAFTESIKAKDMSEFYSFISDMWKKQTSVAALNKGFANMMKQNIDLTPLIHQNFKIEEPPEISDKGVLKMKVLYSGKPLNLNVNIEVFLDYVNENGKWKLIGIDIHAKK